MEGLRCSLSGHPITAKGMKKFKGENLNMEKKTTKKFTIALCAMAFALVAVVGGLIGVWAATQQSISSDFNVQYEVGKHIAGAVSATYQVGTKEAAALGQKVTFTSSETVTSHSLTTAAQDITFGPGEAVVFTYTIENHGAEAFVATLSDTAARNNVTVAYGENLEDMAITVPAATFAADGSMTQAGSVQVTITVTATNPNAATATYVSNATAGTVVSWSLQQA